MLNQTYRVRSDVLVEEIEDEILLLDLRQNAYFRINPIAAKIFSGLRAHEKFATIVDNLAQEFSLPREQVARDATVFIQELLDAGLAEPA